MYFGVNWRHEQSFFSGVNWIEKKIIYLAEVLENTYILVRFEKEMTYLC